MTLYEDGVKFFGVGHAFQIFLSFKCFASSGTQETQSSPRIAVLLSDLISRYESAAHCRISDIADRLLDRYDA